MIKNANSELVRALTDPRDATMMQARPGLKLSVLLVFLMLRAEVAHASHSSHSGSNLTLGEVLGVLAAGGCLIGILSYIAYYVKKTRRRKLGEVTRALGLAYRPGGNDADRKLPSGCSLMKAGDYPTISNVVDVTRTDELDFTLFDFDYTENYGHRAVHSQTVIRMQSPLLKLPAFRLFPRPLISERGVTFPDSPAFNNYYVLHTEDEPGVRGLFSPALRQTLETFEHLTIQGTNDILFIFRADHRIKPEDIAARIEDHKRILAGFVEAQRLPL